MTLLKGLSIAHGHDHADYIWESNQLLPADGQLATERPAVDAVVPVRSGFKYPVLVDFSYLSVTSRTFLRRRK